MRESLFSILHLHPNSRVKSPVEIGWENPHYMFQKYILHFSARRAKLSFISFTKNWNKYPNQGKNAEVKYTSSKACYKLLLSRRREEPRKNPRGIVFLLTPFRF